MSPVRIGYPELIRLAGRSIDLHPGGIDAELLEMNVDPIGARRFAMTSAAVFGDAGFNSEKTAGSLFLLGLCLGYQLDELKSL